MRRPDAKNPALDHQKCPSDPVEFDRRRVTHNAVTSTLKKPLIGPAQACGGTLPSRLTLVSGESNGLAMGGVPMKTWLACAALTFVLAASADGVVAQIPDKFTNLQVLPKEIAKGDLVGRMREITFALGVRCNHCHVGPDDLHGMDFASDENATKRTARVMMKMVDEINGRLIKGIETSRSSRVTVKCQTCHHGITVPEPIEEIVAHDVASGGTDAALTRYRELRKALYGAAAYDFSEAPLNNLADHLLRAGKKDEALALLLANIEYFPDDVWTLSLLGNARKARGEKEEAIAAFRKVLDRDPENAWAKKQLEELTATEGSKK